MRIYTKAGDLAFSTMTFPDGQPHFRLDTFTREFDDVTIETAICSPRDLFDVLMVADVLRRAGYSVVNLDIRYLLGARMDRPISLGEPFTLDIVARLINSAGFARVRILDVHSDVALKLIRNSRNVLPVGVIDQVSQTLDGDFYVCAPDKGATPRVTELFGHVMVQGIKKRDPNTGKLSGFGFDTLKSIRGVNILICDDICDGGGTFVGLAKELKSANGCADLYLYVTHGLFTKGTDELRRAGFTKIFTTNSVYDAHQGAQNLITIPVSMEKMK